MKPKDEFCIRSIYCNMIYKRNKKEQVAIRLSMVRYAQKFGIKAAAREFGCSKNTVKTWKRRYEAQGAGARAKEEDPWRGASRHSISDGQSSKDLLAPGRSARSEEA